MPKFIYKVRDKDGKILRGILDGIDKRDITKAMMDKGYFVMTVKPWKEGKTATFKSINLDERIRFTHKLSAMLKAGIPILPALRMLWEQSENKELQLIISENLSDLSQGGFFSDSLKKFPNVFSDTYISLVEIGEKGGDFPKALDEVVAHLIRQKEIIRKVQSALLYPIIVLVMAVAVVIAMLTLVVPVFKKAFMKMKVDLPGITKLLISISDFFLAFWWIFLVLGIAAAIFYNRYQKTEKGAYNLDALKLKIPVIGNLIFSVSLSRFIYSFHALAASGVAIEQTLSSSAKSCANKVMEENINLAGESIAKGRSISNSLDEKHFFPVFVIQMISIGETSGTLINMMRILIDFLDEEIDFRITKIFTLLGPAAIIGVGFVVLFVLIGIYSPIFTLWGAIG